MHLPCASVGLDTLLSIAILHSGGFATHDASRRSTQAEDLLLVQVTCLLRHPTLTPCAQAQTVLFLCACVLRCLSSPACAAVFLHGDILRSQHPFQVLHDDGLHCRFFCTAMVCATDVPSLRRYLPARRRFAPPFFCTATVYAVDVPSLHRQHSAPIIFLHGDV